MSAHHTASQAGPALRNSIDTLPVEVVNQIFSYLIHPRSRLPGLTEAQSHHTVSGPTRIAIRCNEEFTTPANTDPWAANLFTISFTQHPFNALALASRRCHKLVESYSGHLVRICNPFNLPFALFDQHGSSSVWPDLSGIVYRRLWLQHAPRKCVYCDAVIDQYPFPVLKRLVTACGRCFYLLTLTLDEIERQYHVSAATILATTSIRGDRKSIYFLREDVEALALQLYGTRAFHHAHVHQWGKPCSICAITKFTPEIGDNKPRSSQKVERRLASQRRRTRRSIRA